MTHPDMADKYINDYKQAHPELFKKEKNLKLIKGEINVKKNIQ